LRQAYPYGRRYVRGVKSGPHSQAPSHNRPNVETVQKKQRRKSCRPPLSPKGGRRRWGGRPRYHYVIHREELLHLLSGSTMPRLTTTRDRRQRDEMSLLFARCRSAARHSVIRPRVEIIRIVPSPMMTAETAATPQSARRRGGMYSRAFITVRAWFRPYGRAAIEPARQSSRQTVEPRMPRSSTARACSQSPVEVRQEVVRWRSRAWCGQMGNVVCESYRRV